MTLEEARALKNEFMRRLRTEEGMDEITKQAYYGETVKLAGELIEDAYVDEHMKLAGYSPEEIEKLRGIYRRAREVRKKQEKPIEGLEKFMDGAPPRMIDRPVNPLGLGDTSRWPHCRDVRDKGKLKPFKALLSEEMAVHQGKDREDISNAVRWVRETAFMNKPPAVPATPGKAGQTD